MLCVVLGGIAVGAEAPEAENPLADVPSEPGEHIAKIRALGDNEWLSLGTPKPDPKWGVARGRAWGSRQAAAPDLRGAFLCGSGIHGFVMPNGHYMDDLWFYDINRNRWVCLYPGANRKTLERKLDEHGFEVNTDGEQAPVSYLSHTYGNVTYDPDLQKYVIIYKHCFWWTRALPQRRKWLGVPPDEKSAYNTGDRIDLSARHPIFWDVKTGKWERRHVPGDEGPPQQKRGSTKYWNIGLVQYIPWLEKTFVGWRGQVWLYDYKENKWTDVEVKPDPDIPWNHYRLEPQLGALDPKRKRLWTAAGKRFLYFDFEESRWVNPNAEGPQPVFGNSNSASLHFDSANGVVTCLLAPQKKPKPWGSMHVYKPDENKWTTLEWTFPDDVPTKYVRQHAFYDPNLNAHFYYLAGDSRNKPATILVYRYKRAGAER
ncbi:MAG: hypothetical protein ACOC8E_00210 [Planctomycetota bacterium]